MLEKYPPKNPEERNHHLISNLYMASNLTEVEQAVDFLTEEYIKLVAKQSKGVQALVLDLQFRSRIVGAAYIYVPEVDHSGDNKGTLWETLRKLTLRDLAGGSLVVELPSEIEVSRPFREVWEDHVILSFERAVDPAGAKDDYFILARRLNRTKKIENPKRDLGAIILNQPDRLT